MYTRMLAAQIASRVPSVPLSLAAVRHARAMPVATTTAAMVGVTAIVTPGTTPATVAVLATFAAVSAVAVAAAAAAARVAVNPSGA